MRIEPLTGQMTTVHPLFDAEENNSYNLVTRYNAVSHYRLYRVDSGGGRAMVGQVASTKPAYMHSFGMTKRYAIFTEFPLRVQPMALLLWLRPYIENFTWEPRRGTPFYVLDRHTGELVGRWDADPFFAFHHVNAWEEGDDIVLDIDAYEDNRIIDAFFLDRLANPANALPFGHLRRYRIPLQGKKGGRLKYETLSDECAELARFDSERLPDGRRLPLCLCVEPEQGQPHGLLQPDRQDRHPDRAKRGRGMPRVITPANRSLSDGRAAPGTTTACCCRSCWTSRMARRTCSSLDAGSLGGARPRARAAANPVRISRRVFRGGRRMTIRRRRSSTSGTSSRRSRPAIATSPSSRRFAAASTPASSSRSSGPRATASRRC